MITFVSALAALVLGYVLYGAFVERVFGKLHDFEGLVVQVLLVAHGSLLRSGKQESLAEKMIAGLGVTVSTTESALTSQALPSRALCPP